jgi:Ca2+-binding EF-hand superfamily protein
MTTGMMAPGGQSAPGYQTMMERRKARFTEMDKDKDGKVSVDEFLATGKARYAASDRDKDGKVTVWEFRSARRI